MVNTTWRRATMTGETWWKERVKLFPYPSNTRSRNFSSSSLPIIKSPPLVSLDTPDIWSCSTTSTSSSDFQISRNGSAASVIDGKLVADEIRSRLAIEVRKMKEFVGKVPGLALILVGQRRDSQCYVRNKISGCEEVGIKSFLTELPDTCSEDEVCNALSHFNKNPYVHGILVQLPLPQHLDEGRILDVISLEKDVDGFHPLNIGNMAIQGREPLFIPCTPKGCIELLLRYNVELMGKKAVVIGKSNIVGLPMSLLLQRHHATVSVVHAFTNNPDQVAREADILVVAAGVRDLVRASWLKPGVVVVDVGTNPVEDPNEEYGYRLTGDVCYEEAATVASAITPVPGGVGPMTVAMLLLNTLESAKRAFNFT